MKFKKFIMSLHIVLLLLYLFRVMFGYAGVPSVIMFFGMLFMPESPRWLVFHNKQEKARTVLMRTRTPEEAKQELDSIIADYEEHQKQAMGMSRIDVVCHCQGDYGTHNMCVRKLSNMDCILPTNHYVLCTDWPLWINECYE